MSEIDIRFYFDPVCPFAWMTSKWVRLVCEQRTYRVQWRFISLRMVNAELDYDAHFPPGYELAHTGGLRLLRVAAAARSDLGDAGVDAFYRAIGARLWDSAPLTGPPHASPDDLAAALATAELPAALAEQADESGWDSVISAETQEALALTGKDVGTPILHFRPPGGVAFFGPVISRLPTAEEAARLWDHVIGLAEFGGFAELKRSLRELPQLAAFGVAPGEVGATAEAFTQVADALADQAVQARRR